MQLQIDPDTFAAEMEAKGVGTDRPVVVCPPLMSTSLISGGLKADDASGSAAAEVQLAEQQQS